MMRSLELPSSQASPVLDRLLHSNLWCGQSTTTSFCQAFWLDKVSARMGIRHLLLVAKLP